MHAEGNRDWKNAARIASDYSFELSLIGLLFVAVPLFGLAAMITGAISIRASRKIDAPAYGAALFGFVLGFAESAIATWFYVLLFTGQFTFH